MNDQLTSLKNDPQYSLSERERVAMRAHLERVTAATVLKERSAPSSWFTYFAQPAPLAALALVIAVSTSSVSMAAQGALPGELLYPVKRGVTERLEVALAPTTEARAVARVRHVEERLEETEVLAARMALTPSVAEAAAESVSTEIASAERAAYDLSVEGDVAAASNVQNRIAIALSAHAELLRAHAENFDGESRETLKALALVAQGSADTALVADVPSTEAGDQLRMDASRARAKERLAKLEERLDEGNLASETRDALREEYAYLEERFAASEALAFSDPVAAEFEYDEVGRLAYRARTFLESAARIADESSKEVVVAFASAPVAALAAPEPMARSAKSAEPEQIATLMMASEATTSEGDAMAMTMSAPEPPAPVMFELRERQAP